MAALLLQKQGWEVIGAFLRNGVEAPEGVCRPRQGCCSEDDARDAALVADRLGIPFHSLDMETEFQVIQDYFREEYTEGRTPNPCARCNRDIKFGALAAFADAVGASHLATGHYAQIKHGPKGPELWRGADAHKDQSYVLFPVHPNILERTILPVGGLQKSETRVLAAEAGVRTAQKPDSQEICFVPTGDYRDRLRESGGLGRKGNFVFTDGTVLGEHDGYMGFTRGQRRGLGIAWSEPLYVLDIQPESGDVLLGTRESVGSPRATVSSFQCFASSLAVGDVWEHVQVQYRSSPGGQAARLRCISEGTVEIEFHDPAESVNPGQGLAVYQGDRCLGGGWIERADFSSVPLEV